MNTPVRVAVEAGALTLGLVALGTAAFYMVAFRSWVSGAVVAPALGLGIVAGFVVFLSVLAVVSRRLRSRNPVLGAGRGAVIAVLAVAVAASVHTCFTSGSAGFLYSLFGQVGYACLFFGGPAAVLGALFGRSVDARLTRMRRT